MLPPIIGLTGLKRSGKDTAAIAIQSLGYQKIAFADGIKAMLRAYMRSEDDLQTTINSMVAELLKLQGISSHSCYLLLNDDVYADTVSEYLFGLTPKQFKASLIDWGNSYIGGAFWSGQYHHMRVDDQTIERCIDGDLKEVAQPTLGDCTPRHFMQTIGTEWGRQSIHPDLWVRLTMARAKWGPTVISDVRFDNEAQAIRDAGGVVMKIVRPRPITPDGHSSEAGVSDQLIDMIVDNNSSIVDLQSRVTGLISNYNLEVA